MTLKSQFPSERTWFHDINVYGGSGEKKVLYARVEAALDPNIILHDIMTKLPRYMKETHRFHMPATSMVMINKDTDQPLEINFGKVIGPGGQVRYQRLREIRHIMNQSRCMEIYYQIEQ